MSSVYEHIPNELTVLDNSKKVTASDEDRVKKKLFQKLAYFKNRSISKIGLFKKLAYFKK